MPTYALNCARAVRSLIMRGWRGEGGAGVVYRFDFKRKKYRQGLATGSGDGLRQGRPVRGGGRPVSRAALAVAEPTQGVRGFGGRTVVLGNLILRYDRAGSSASGMF